MADLCLVPQVYNANRLAVMHVYVCVGLHRHFRAILASFGMN